MHEYLNCHEVREKVPGGPAGVPAGVGWGCHALWRSEEMFEECPARSRGPWPGRDHTSPTPCSPHRGIPGWLAAHRPIQDRRYVQLPIRGAAPYSPKPTNCLVTNSDALPHFIVVIQVDNDAFLRVPLSPESTRLLLGLAAKQGVGRDAASEDGASGRPVSDQYVGIPQTARAEHPLSFPNVEGQPAAWLSPVCRNNYFSDPNQCRLVVLRRPSKHGL